MQCWFNIGSILASIIVFTIRNSSPDEIYGFLYNPLTEMTENALEKQGVLYSYLIVAAFVSTFSCFLPLLRNLIR
jgi:hypothetical protein